MRTGLRTLWDHRVVLFLRLYRLMAIHRSLVGTNLAQLGFEEEIYHG